MLPSCLAACFNLGAAPAAGDAVDITEVRVFPVNEDKLKAFASVTFDGCFVIRDLKIIDGASGFFVAMPSKKMKDGTFKDIAHPLNNDTRQMIQARILEAYGKLKETTARPPRRCVRRSRVDAERVCDVSPQSYFPVIRSQ